MTDDSTPTRPRPAEDRDSRRAQDGVAADPSSLRRFPSGSPTSGRPGVVNTVKLALAGALVLVGGSYASIRSFAHGRILAGTVTAWFALVLLLIAVDAVPRRAQRAGFQLIRGSALAPPPAERRAGHPPGERRAGDTPAASPTSPIDPPTKPPPPVPVQVPDEWVHLASTRPMRRATLAAFALFSAGMLAAVVAGLLQIVGIIPPLNATAGLKSQALAVLLGGALAAASGRVVQLGIQQRRRTGTYSRRPAGVALGASAVLVHVPGRDLVMPWSDIVDIDASEIPGRAQSIPVIRFALRDDRPLTQRAQLVPTAGVRVPVDALFTALTWYLRHPAARRELGRAEGERRLAEWRRQALGTQEE